MLFMHISMQNDIIFFRTENTNLIYGYIFLNLIPTWTQSCKEIESILLTRQAYINRGNGTISIYFSFLLTSKS